MIPGGIFVAAGLVLAIGGVIVFGMREEAKQRRKYLRALYDLEGDIKRIGHGIIPERRRHG